MSAADGIFMSIPEALLPGLGSKSFEEVRIEDYIKAYQTTGKPPPSVPQEPTDDLSRKALNLPPLFKPQSVLGTTPTTYVSTNPQRITDPAGLPPAQEFRMRTADTEKYHAISCMLEYEFFSHEELRYHAYLAGHKQPPVPIKMDPFVSLVKDAPVATTSGEDKLQHMCAQPGYDKHSPEEFHIAYLLHRRDMTSAELFQLQNPTAVQPFLTPSPATPVATTPLPMTPLPQPVYASTTPSIPKFSFGFK